jgi:hypothetical protein
MKITVYTVACDDDYGTRAMVFTNERAAVNALLDELAVDVTFIGNERQELIDEYFDPDGDFYEAIAPYKSDMDTYSIDEHTLEIDVEEVNGSSDLTSRGAAK